jgi:hypothetical protein
MRRPVAAAGSALCLLLAACTGGSASSGVTGASGASGGPSSAVVSTSPTPVPYASLAASAPAALGTTTAKPRFVDQPVTLEVLAVTATTNSTVLRFRISTATPLLDVFPGLLHEGFGLPDVGGVDLVAKDVNQRLHVSYAAKDICLCSWMPHDLGPQGAFLSAMYPALPPSVTSVEVAAPGFPQVAVAVTRG